MKRYSFLLLLCIGLFACKNNNKVSDASSSSPKVIQEPKQTFQSPIVNTYWKAVEIMGEQVVESEEWKEEPYLNLVEIGNVSGHGGCNRLFGKFSIEGKNVIQFSDIAMTEMACEFKHYDQTLLEALSLAREFELTDEGKMLLTVGKRAPLAVFVVASSEKE